MPQLGRRAGWWMLTCRVLADFVVIVHGLIAAFAVVGAVAVAIGGCLRWRWVGNFWFRGVHLALVVIVAMFPLTGRLCPLTDLEQWLRLQAGETAYPGSFIGHWVHELLFIDVSPEAIAVSYCLFAVLVIAMLALVPVRLPAKLLGRRKGV